jgi:heterodisulfide reductase subunit A-like polyferredoxin
MVKHNVKVDEKLCLSCCGCISICPQDAVILKGREAFILNEKCICCGICIKTCPVGAIKEDF